MQSAIVAIIAAEFVDTSTLVKTVLKQIPVALDSADSAVSHNY